MLEGTNVGRTKLGTRVLMTQHALKKAHQRSNKDVQNLFKVPHTPISMVKNLVNRFEHRVKLDKEKISNKTYVFHNILQINGVYLEQAVVLNYTEASERTVIVKSYCWQIVAMVRFKSGKYLYYEDIPDDSLSKKHIFLEQEGFKVSRQLIRSLYRAYAKVRSGSLHRQ